MERKIDELVKSYREDMIQSLEELVSIPSVINLENAGRARLLAWRFEAPWTGF